MIKQIVAVFLSLALMSSPAFAGRDFNGTSQHAVAASVDLSGTQSITLCFWLYVTGGETGDNMVFEFSANSGGVQTGFWFDDSTAARSIRSVGNVGTNDATYPYPAHNEWNHICAIYDRTQAANEVDMYYNGTLQTASTRPNTNNNTNNFAVDELNFMARNSSSLLRAGQLASVAVWNIRLSGSDITSLNGGTLPSSVQTTNLKGYWPFCGTASPEPDVDEAHDAVLTGSPAQVSHPATMAAECAAENPIIRTTSASADDAQQVGTTVTIDGTTIGASLDATTEWAGMRFLNMTIPVGATINTATLEVVPSATTEDEPLVSIFFEDADNCSTFTTGASDISNRSMTSSVAWSSTNMGADGATYFSAPDLASILQTVVNRVGWASGNAVCVIIQGGATATRDLTIEAWDLGPGTNPPRLTVGFTVASGAVATRSFGLLGVGQ